MLRRHLFLTLVALLLFADLPAQLASLPRSTPEAEGVSSSQIIKFIEAVENSDCEMHSYMVLRHGKVIAEGWWNPYRPDLKHTLYSCSKSFTATAIGFAVQENLLSVDDRVISIFPKEIPDTVSTYLSGLTVRHLLTMAAGHDPDPTFNIAFKDSNWIKGFLATPVVDKPGTRFLYNSMCTYMLSAIMQKLTGETLLNYLKPRLFEPLGIEGMDWETDTRGINTGGWGLRVKTEDMAKFAQLFLQKGNWNGKQILSPDWIEEASTKHILQNPAARLSQRDSSDWLQGYGYQMWQCRHNAYRGDGAFGQFMIVMPEQDAVVILTAESKDLQGEINLVWDHLLPAFTEKSSLPENKTALVTLRNKEKALALQPLKNSSSAAKIGKKVYEIRANKAKLKTISFDSRRNNISVDFFTGSDHFKIDFAEGKWLEGETYKPGPSLLAGAVENMSMIYPAKIAASYSWVDKNTLQLQLRYIESPHSEIYTCRFENDRLRIGIKQSLRFGNDPIHVEGTLRTVKKKGAVDGISSVY